MAVELNETHDPARRSFVSAANADANEFPLQNLPFGVFSHGGLPPRGGVAIGDRILDLATAWEAGLFKGLASEAAIAAAGPVLNDLLALGNEPASALRRQIAHLLEYGSSAQASVEPHLVQMDIARMHMPVAIRSFTDMCVSTFHIGRRRGKDEHGEPLCPPMFRTIPVGYDGRASSVSLSGTPVRRPNGTWQRVPDQGDPEFGPEPRLDYELELGMWLGGAGNAAGTPHTVRGASEAIFGYSLVNDWSARGIQMWETMLGPFLGKSFMTTISPWIVTAEALAPFAAARFERPATDPQVPAHLDDRIDALTGGIDLAMEAWLEAPGHATPMPLCRTNFRHMYWTPAQMIAHHASNGCALGAGDLVASGTCSGPAREEAACLMEALLEGPLKVPEGGEQSWLKDGDTVILRARADRAGFRGIGFGEATATVQPAIAWNTL